MKTPLTIMSTMFGLAFLDGAFSWGLSDGFYTFTGLVMIIGVIWMWFIELRKKN